MSRSKKPGERSSACSRPGPGPERSARAPNRETVLIGTRTSRLAMAQAEEILARLRRCFPERSFAVRGIVTGGDRLKTWKDSAGKGIFVKEIEEALQAGKIDMAVHSLKDVPCEIPGGLEISAVARRRGCADVLVSMRRCTLRSLKPRACVGTSSPRRAVQLRALRPDVIIKEIRGNIDTRLRKLARGEYDAIIAAAAALERLKITGYAACRIPLTSMLPAPGQGALAVETRKNDKRIKAAAEVLNHRKTNIEAAAERAFLKGMGGGCRRPVAALAKMRRGKLTLTGFAASEDGRCRARGTAAGSAGSPERIGLLLARRIRARLRKNSHDAEA